MYCSNCGQPVTEGKAFCKNCGAPVVAPGVPDPTMVRPPEDQPTVPITPPSPPPPPSFQPPPPPRVMAGYGPGRQPPQGPSSKSGNTGLIVGIIAAAAVVLAGIGVGTWLLVRDGGTTGTTTVIQTTTTTAGPTTTATTALETTTSSTVTPETTAGGFTEQDYLVAVGEMITRLNSYDTRIPQLADEINRTAPDVPQWVYDELNTMMVDLEKAYDDLGYLPLAPGFEDADYWLDEAILYMSDRVYYTLQGIESMWYSGAAGDNFDKGRDARDKYRDAMAKFWEVVPAS